MKRLAIYAVFLLGTASSNQAQSLLESNAANRKEARFSVQPKFIINYTPPGISTKALLAPAPDTISNSLGIIVQKLKEELKADYDKKKKDSINIKDYELRLKEMETELDKNLTDIIASSVSLYKAKAADYEKITIQLQKEHYQLEYKIYNSPFLLDSIKSYSEKSRIITDTLSAIYAENAVAYNYLDNVKEKETALNSIISELETLQSDNTQTYFIKKEKYNQLVSKAAVQKDKIDTTIKQTNYTFSLIADKWNRNILSFTAQQSKPESKDLGAIPGLTSLLGQKEVNFNLSVLGSSILSKLGSNTVTYGEIRLFTGSIKTDSTQNLRTLLLPEASSFGLAAKVTIGLGESRKDSNLKKFGINFEANFLGKKLKPENDKEENTISPFVFHPRIGFEWMIVPKLLSVYINGNGILPFDNNRQYKERIADGKLFKTFWDFGTKMLLNPADNGISKLGLKIKVDLGFIVNGGDVRAIIKNDDIVTPTFRFGLQKDF